MPGYKPHATGFKLLGACGLKLVANQIHNIRGRTVKWDKMGADAPKGKPNGKRKKEAIHIAVYGPQIKAR